METEAGAVTSKIPVQHLRAALRRNRWWIVVFCVGVALIRWWAQRGKPERLAELPIDAGRILAIHHAQALLQRGAFFAAANSPAEASKSFTIYAVPVTGGPEHLVLSEPDSVIPPITFTNTDLYYFVYRSQPHQIAGSEFQWTMPITLRRCSLSGGLPRDVLTIQDTIFLSTPGAKAPLIVAPSIAVASDRIYWLRQRTDLPKQFARPISQQRWTPHADLMQTLLKDGQTSQLAAELPANSALAAGDSGVYCVVHDFDRISKVYHYDRHTSQMRIVHDLDFSPVEYSGRLYGIRINYPRPSPQAAKNSRMFGSADFMPMERQFVSAAPDGSDSRVIESGSGFMALLEHRGHLIFYGSALDARSDRLQLILRQVTSGGHSKAQKIQMPEGRVTAGLLADGGYLYFVIEEHSGEKALQILYRVPAPDD